MTKTNNTARQLFRRYCLAFITLLTMPMVANAADWVLILTDEDKEIEIDRQSVRPNKGAWFKYINTPPDNDTCAGIGKKVAYSKQFVEANCNEFTLRTKQEINYSEDESVLPYCGYNNPKAAFTEFAPETVGEVYFNAICHSSARAENKYAIYQRNSKAAKAKAELNAKKQLKQLEEAYWRSDEERARAKQAEEEARKYPWLKAQGAACSKSSECAGLLVCTRINTTQMQCMPSEFAIRFNPDL